MKKTVHKNSGIRLRTLNIVMIIAAAALSVFLLYATYKTTISYSVMRETTDKYITCQQAAADMQATSDYLTEQARTFARTGELKYLENYFKETQVTRRRDRALESLESYLSGTQEDVYLSRAMDGSSTLEEREYYSMRLTAEAKGYELGTLPQKVRKQELTDEDKALTDKEKSELAEAILYDDTYLELKDQIHENVVNCTETLIERTRLQQVESSERLLELLRQQYILICALVVIVFVLALFTSLLVIRPLRKNVHLMQNQSMLPMTGSYELQYMAMTYNNMFRENQKHKDKLSYEAMHDVLTGLYNRSVFESMRPTLKERSVALILIDVDKFKEINDRYGHDVGDRVLKSVAQVLTDSFRTDDCICRIGGDEFAVIVVRVSSELKDTLSEKIKRANDKLLNPTDGLPPVSLSVGVAFGDRDDPTDDIFKDADTALYRVKQNGRSGCGFY